MKKDIYEAVLEAVAENTPGQKNALTSLWS